MPIRTSWLSAAMLLAAAAAPPLLSQEPSAEDAEFFEKKIRPVLASRCFKCHGEKEQKGGLRLDSRAALLQGGESGPAVVPGKPEEGYLIDAIHYGDTYKMPPDGKLPPEQIEALTAWVRRGAPWPGGGGAASKPQESFDLRERAKHWSFQPLTQPVPPQVRDAAWPQSELDRFILARLEAAGLRPAPAADAHTLIRRIYFDLLGLPPPPEEVESFARDQSPRAYEALVDRLLQSPRFGERWGRHWLDLVRYAESRGHEFDYNVPNAWQYRDYVIRAFNADVPYRDLVIEHIAGDLLPAPRRHPERGFDESVLGTGFWYLGEWVHSPVDIKLDEVERLDNMVDVFSKAFLGLTISCARCHDHKFDPISQRDYYALFGFLQSSSYRQVRFETAPAHAELARALTDARQKLEAAIRQKTAAHHAQCLAQLAEYLLAARAVLASEIEVSARPREIVFEDFESGTYAGWTVTGTAFGDAPYAKDKMAAYQGDVGAAGRWLANSHNVRQGEDSARGDAHQGTLLSRKFTIELPQIEFLIGGGAHAGKTCVNLLVEGKAVLTATGKNENRMARHAWDVRPFLGKEAQIEVVDKHDGGWGNIGIDHIVFCDRGKHQRLEPRDLAPRFRQQLDALAEEKNLNSQALAAWVVEILNAGRDVENPLHAWSLICGRPEPAPGQLSEQLDALARQREQRQAAFRSSLEKTLPVVDYAQSREFYANGETFSTGLVTPGGMDISVPGTPFQIALYGAVRRDPFWNGLRLAPGTQSDPGRQESWERAGKSFKTPSFELRRRYLCYLAAGGGRAYAAVDSHYLQNGPLHGAFATEWTAETEAPRWINHDLRDYVGHRAHVEFSVRGGEPLSILMVVQSDEPLSAAWTPEDAGESLETALAAAVRQAVSTRQAAPDTAAAARILATEYQRQFAAAAERWRLTLTNSTLDSPRAPSRHDARLWNTLLQQAQGAGALAELQSQWQAQWEQLSGRIQPESQTAPAIWEGSGVNERLLIRGNPKTPGDVVPRRFLEVLSGCEAPAWHGSGRLELAQFLTDPSRNPFLPRVMVNRVWQHLTGRGLAASVDNLGVLGEAPTHPELLDFLAQQFIRDGWSVKRLIRSIVLSATYRMASRLPENQEALAREKDGGNLLLHKMRVRRLEAECIRDAMLAISGRLDTTMHGPSVPVHLTPFMQGRGRPESGPLDGNGRRSIYLAVRRNFLSPMMLAFDAPIPFTTMGRRNVSNVPAQALILMNDPFVAQQAEVWAARALREEDLSDAGRVERLYLAAFARPPRADEQERALRFLAEQQEQLGLPPEQRRDVRLWADLCHVLFQLKEFVFLD